MSARISGVKNFESKAVSLLRGLPLSQVQSQSENGTIFSFAGGVATEAVLNDCAIGGWIGAAAAIGSAAILGGASNAGDTSAGAVRLLSSASSTSIRAFIAANSLTMSLVAGSGAGVGRAEGTSAIASCRTATFSGASDGATVWAEDFGACANARIKISVEGKIETAVIVRKRVFIISRASPFRSQFRLGSRN